MIVDNGLILFSALEQFRDTPVCNAVIFNSEPNSYAPLSVNEIEFCNNLKESLALYYECLDSRLPYPPGALPPVCFPADIYDLMITLQIDRIMGMDYILSHTKYRPFVEYLNSVPNTCILVSPLPEGQKSWGDFYFEREAVSVNVFVLECLENHIMSPFRAEQLIYRVTHMPTGYDDILFYIKDGLKTSEGVDLIFYETINAGFTAKMKEFETNFFKNNIGFFDGWMAERWEDIYNTTLRHKRERCVPFDMAFTFAIREYFFMSVYWDLFTNVMPSNIVDRNSRNLIRLFFNNIDLFKLFVARRLCEDNITMLEYHKALCAEREDKPECPTCMCLIDYPFKNDHGIVPVQNKNLLNPVLLSGAMYYPIPGDDILSFFISSLYGSLCGLEEMRNPLRMVTVIFLSMGLLNIFTLFVSFFFIFLYYIFCFKLYVISPNVYQYFYESIYTFVLDIVCDQAGLLAVVHFPLVFSVFNVILCGNIIGLIPFGFTITSHLTFTFSFGLFIFTGIILLTVLNKRYDFFRLFIPTGVPKALVPLLCVIEVISYVFRVISLSVRLFANMMAGHALLHILLGFVPIIMGFKNVTRFVFVFPIAIIVLITILEIGISILQSYVFIVLISIYLRDCYGVAGH